MKKPNKLFLAIGCFSCLILSYGFFHFISTPAAATVTQQTITNLGILIKFSNSDDIVARSDDGTPLHIDDATSLNNAEQLLNSDQPITTTAVVGDSESTIAVPSVKKYYETQSYGQLSISTILFPKSNSQIIAYQDSHPIEYYLPKNDSNSLGYANHNESLQREAELLANAVHYISNQIDQVGITADSLDTNHDGRIDMLSLFVEGAADGKYTIGFQDLLWSHKSTNTNDGIQILGKTASAYTLVYCTDYTEAAGTFSLNRSGYGVIIHELGHILGYQDLYRYGNNTQSLDQPVGFYDIMGRSPSSNPADFLAYFTSEYQPNTNWHNPLPVITQTTTNLTLNKPSFSDPSEQRAIIIRPNNGQEFFVIEYYAKRDTYSSYTADQSGAIIYRVNDNNYGHGNANNDTTGAQDHVFVFRPGENSLGAAQGNLTQATINTSRPKLGKALSTETEFDPEAIYYSNGNNSGIIIEVISQNDNSITLNITLPEVTGDGSISNPYVINTVTQFFYLLQNDTTGKYYTLANDLDFDGYEYPAINFYGYLDGQNHVLRNINAIGHGVFSSLGNMNQSASIKNLRIENLNVKSTGSSVGGSLGGLANATENSLIENIHLLSGSVANTASLNDAAATGGLVGNANETTIINNSSSNLAVSAPKNVGGFVGLNMNARFTNVTATGKVTGSTNVGGFIGAQDITSTYQVPQNATYNADLNPGGAVGGYLGYLHDLKFLSASELSKGITPLKHSETLNENMILQQVGLTKSDQYLVGFQLGTDIETVRQLFANLPNVTIDNFKNVNGQEITHGPIATAMQFDVSNSAETFHYIVVIKGDANGDGAIYATDYVKVRNHIMNQGGLSGAYLRAADINNDGNVHATDYVKIRNYIMHGTAIEQK